MSSNNITLRLALGCAPPLVCRGRRQHSLRADGGAPGNRSRENQARLGETACPFNALYWDFFRRNSASLERNPRIGMAYRQLEKMDDAAIPGLTEQARVMLAKLDEL